MSLRQKLLQAINIDPKTAPEIAEELEIDRKVVQDNISAAIKENLAKRYIEDGKPIYAITEKGRERLGNPHGRIKQRPASGAAAQPEVADNTGSAGSDASSAFSTEARAPIVYTAETAEIAGELAIAMDRIKALNAKIDEQAATIDNLRIECSNLEKLSGARDILTPEQLIDQIEQIIGHDFILTIEKDCELTLMEKETEEEFGLSPDDLYAFIEAARFINARKVA